MNRKELIERGMMFFDVMKILIESQGKKFTLKVEDDEEKARMGYLMAMTCLNYRGEILK